MLQKTLRVDRTAAAKKMSLTRPAAGGEFRQRNSFLSYYLLSLPMVKEAKVYERTAGAAIVYEGSREALFQAIWDFTYDDRRLEEMVPKNSGRELNQDAGPFRSRCGHRHQRRC